MQHRIAATSAAQNPHSLSTFLCVAYLCGYKRQMRHTLTARRGSRAPSTRSYTRSMKPAVPFSKRPHTHNGIQWHVTVYMRKRFWCSAQLFDHNFEPRAHDATGVNHKNAGGGDILVKSLQSSRNLALKRCVHVPFVCNCDIACRHGVHANRLSRFPVLWHGYVEDVLGHIRRALRHLGGNSELSIKRLDPF